MYAWWIKYSLSKFLPQKKWGKNISSCTPPLGMCPLDPFSYAPYVCYILLCIKHSYNQVFLSKSKTINVLTELVEHVLKICFFYMLCHYSEHSIVLLYQFGIRISAFCYLSFHFSWLYVLSLIMIIWFMTRTSLFSCQKKWNILTSMITWLECLQELFPLNLCWINEDINIISFISDIVFENFQMREKMVWYVESPIVLRCTLLALIIYICIMFLLFAKLGRIQHCTIGVTNINTNSFIANQGALSSCNYNYWNDYYYLNRNNY